MTTKSIRLNDSLREHIARELAGEAVAERMKANRGEEHALALSLYDEVMAPFKDLIKETDRRMWATTGQVEILFGVADEVRRINLPDHMPHPGGGYYGVLVLTHKDDMALLDVIEQIQATRKKLEREFHDLKMEILSALNQITTVKRLKEEWPEAAALLPPEMLEEKKDLPAIQIKGVKAKIEAAKAA